MYDRAALMAELERDEGKSHTPYTDSKGNLTIGIGRNLKSVGLYDDEIMFLFDRDISRTESTLDENLTWWRKLSDARQRVLLNMCFNMGWGTLSTFQTFLGLLEHASYDKAAEDMLGTLWAREVGERAVRLAALMKAG